MLPDERVVVNTGGRMAQRMDAGWKDIMASIPAERFTYDPVSERYMFAHSDRERRIVLLTTITNGRVVTERVWESDSRVKNGISTMVLVDSRGLPARARRVHQFAS